ncbi:MAG TPA: nitrous oxide reductase accessory protein NosL [Candidatus Latescibacteria bacterium]|jgi:copper chaperone NosL|nr:nitrous oxide reductase accessory protein NosL [Gemmatimonadota bacterium]MDP7361724.1 nitrous oxide reductase accessory protein NosL [Candidatus Latescibacterota bacterium]MDP7634324.1 nitrous oxide reductase accessory protein NosL [Candidatus Latescibacterota bacterium]HJN31068.1 nitrous oxide reductase accessory protein NosL [Candidatus Latescibacterota bacterium]|tara:strand:- start:383 stop:886 length:504 start_codon:yes stop_codon:yes gene_type:complete
MKPIGCVLIGVIALCACGEQAETVAVAVDIDPNASCALDGMLLAVHEGPKSQIQRADGSRAFFCDTKEVFGELLDPVRRRRVIGVWLQTLDEHSWEAHADGWQPADSLLLVVESRNMGAMGPTLAPFAARDAARRFVADYSGRIVRFQDVDATLLEKLQQQGMAHLD